MFFFFLLSQLLSNDKSPEGSLLRGSSGDEASLGGWPFSQGRLQTPVLILSFPLGQELP